jgi:hypothetical protein
VAKKTKPKRGRVGRFLQATSYRRGFLGGNRRWFTVWAVLAVTQFLRKYLGRTEEVVYRTELHAGEQLHIVHGLGDPREPA